MDHVLATADLGPPLALIYVAALRVAHTGIVWVVGVKTACATKRYGKLEPIDMSLLAYNKKVTVEPIARRNAAAAARSAMVIQIAEATPATATAATAIAIVHADCVCGATVVRQEVTPRTVLAVGIGGTLYSGGTHPHA